MEYGMKKKNIGKLILIAVCKSCCHKWNGTPALARPKSVPTYGGGRGCWDWVSGHGLWYGRASESKDPPHSYIWAVRKGDPIIYFCPRYILFNAHNIGLPHFSTEQLHVACLK